MLLLQLLLPGGIDVFAAVLQQPPFLGSRVIGRAYGGGRHQVSVHALCRWQSNLLWVMPHSLSERLSCHPLVLICRNLSQGEYEIRFLDHPDDCRCSFLRTCEPCARIFSLLDRVEIDPTEVFKTATDGDRHVEVSPVQPPARVKVARGEDSQITVQHGGIRISEYRKGGWQMAMCQLQKIEARAVYSRAGRYAGG